MDFRVQLQDAAGCADTCGPPCAIEIREACRESDPHSTFDIGAVQICGEQFGVGGAWLQWFLLQDAGRRASPAFS